MIREVTMYQVVCDREGCGRTSADDGSDYSAWGDREQAEDCWQDGDNIITANGRAYCLSCIPADVCPESNDGRHTWTDGACDECGREKE